MIPSLEEKNLAGQEKKIYSDLTFSQYNHIQNFEEKKLFQHFANLIKIRSTDLLPIFYMSDPKKKIENREQVCRSNYTPATRMGVYCFTSVRPSFQNIFRHIFLSSYWWQESDIWSQASYIYICHIVGSVFGPVRFLLPVCRLSWFLYTLNIYAHFSSHFSQQLLMAEIWYLVTSFI